MIKIENAEVMGWEAAIRGIHAKGYRRIKNGRYETFVSNHSKSINLGTYDTADEAANAVFNYRANRLISGVESYGLNINDGVIYEDKYIVFSNGMIFNLHGEIMHGGVDRSGYRHGILNGRNRDYYKVIADCFIENPYNLRDVNHKNGNKLDLDISNLERTTHADNITHAYKNGLMQALRGEDHPHAKLTENDIRRIRTSSKSSYRLAHELNVDSSTVRDIRRRKTWRHVE